MRKEARVLLYMECTLKLDSIDQRMLWVCIRWSKGDDEVDDTLKQPNAHVGSTLSVEEWFGV